MPLLFSRTLFFPLRVTSHVELYGHITDFFDRNDEEALGYPAMPRTGTIGVRSAAGR